MERIAALVEGHTEYHFIKEAYPRAIVQRVLPNGNSVSLDQIVDAIIDQTEILGGEVKKVIVLFDREARGESVDEIIDLVSAKVKERDCYRSHYFGVADRQIENWILSDEAYVQKMYDNHAYGYVGDGVFGKGILKLLHGFDPAPRDKARMLKACCAARGSASSGSLARFREQIDFDWWWAKLT